MNIDLKAIRRAAEQDVLQDSTLVLRPSLVIALVDRLEAAEKDAARIRNEVIEECAIKSWSCGMDWHMRRNNTDVREVGSAIANEIRSMKS